MVRPVLAVIVMLFPPFSGLFAQQPAEPPVFERQIRPLTLILARWPANPSERGHPESAPDARFSAR